MEEVQDSRHFQISKAISMDTKAAWPVGRRGCHRWGRGGRISTEYEALGRARELLEDGDHGGVSVRDSSGNVLCGVRLQLKLGFFGE